MKHQYSIRLVLLSLFGFIFVLAGLSYSAEKQVPGEIVNGYRILTLENHKAVQAFTVYRGDYIKFRLPQGLEKPLAVFPTLKQEKQLTDDLATTSYFKMKQTGIHPFQIASFRGQITVIEYHQENYREVSPKQAAAFIRKNELLILDVRTPPEYARGHLENSILIPVQQLQKRITELTAHKQKPILIYCATGNRSTVASKILIDSNFTNILNLKGGIAAWNHNKYPIVR